MSQPAHKPASYYGNLDSCKWSLTPTLNHLLTNLWEVKNKIDQQKHVSENFLSF